jgi:hypothetical protein
VIVQAGGQVALGLVTATASALLFGSTLAYATGVVLLARSAPGAGTLPGLGSRRRVRDVLARHRGFMVASTPAGLVNALALNLPVFAAAVVGGSAPAAHLALALRIGALPSALFGQALMPILFGEITYKLRCAPREALRSYDRALTGLVIAGCVSVTTLVLAFDTTARWLLGGEWRAGVGALLVLLLPFLISQFVILPLTQTLSAAGGNRQQFTWEVARLFLVGAAFLPMVVGWGGLRTGVLLLSIVTVAACVVLVVLTRAALRRAAPVTDEDATDAVRAIERAGREHARA